ncbi:MAG: hypothetical protein V4550_19410 [Gemmatimonadota bacterium]
MQDSEDVAEQTHAFCHACVEAVCQRHSLHEPRLAAMADALVTDARVKGVPMDVLVTEFSTFWKAEPDTKKLRPATDTAAYEQSLELLLDRYLSD